MAHALLFYPKEQIFCQGLAGGGTQGRDGGWKPPCVSVKLPDEVLLNVFPFKVVFHVQTAMHAIAKYCSSVSKKETIILINSCYICCPSASLFFGLFFIMWLFPSSPFSPPAISPPVSMVKPIVDSIHVYEYTLMMLCCSAVILPLY